LDVYNLLALRASKGSSAATGCTSFPKRGVLRTHVSVTATSKIYALVVWTKIYAGHIAGSKSSMMMLIETY